MHRLIKTKRSDTLKVDDSKIDNTLRLSRSYKSDVGTMAPAWIDLERAIGDIAILSESRNITSPQALSMQHCYSFTKQDW
jgi:hypothetical protein